MPYAGLGVPPCSEDLCARMPDIDVERRDEPAARCSHPPCWRAGHPAVPATVTRITRRRFGCPDTLRGVHGVRVPRPCTVQAACARRLGAAPASRWRAGSGAQRVGQLSGTAPTPHGGKGSGPQSTALFSKAEPSTVAVAASSLSLELSAGLLPAAPARPPAAPRGPAGWTRRLARVLQRSKHPDTWLQDLLSYEGPEFQSFRLLGDAWRSPVATTVQLGRRFDVVEVPEAVASAAWHHLRRRAVECGAVFASGDGWSFIVPPTSGYLPWPAEVRCLTACGVCVPARRARDETHERWWISRPPSGPFTHPLALVDALNLFVGPPSSAPPRVSEPVGPPPAGPLSPLSCSPGA